MKSKTVGVNFLAVSIIISLLTACTLVLFSEGAFIREDIDLSMSVLIDNDKGCADDTDPD